MIIDPKGCGGLLSIKEAVKRGIVSITGSPVVTGHHNSEAIETPQITSRKNRHLTQKFDDVSISNCNTLPIIKNRSNKSHRHQHHHHHNNHHHSNSSNDRLKSASSSRMNSLAQSQSSTNGLKSKSFSKTPIVYDAEFLQSDLLKNADPNSPISLKTTNEEQRRKISGNDVTETNKSDFKETLLQPGQLPKVTASANYEKVTKSKLNEPTPNSTTTGKD